MDDTSLCMVFGIKTNVSDFTNFLKEKHIDAYNNLITEYGDEKDIDWFEVEDLNFVSHVKICPHGDDELVVGFQVGNLNNIECGADGDYPMIKLGYIQARANAILYFGDAVGLYIGATMWG